MTDAYRVVRYEPAYESRVATLQTHLWGPDVDVNRSYLRWKYLENPYEPAPLLYLALHGDDVVGVRGMFGAAWTVADQQFRIPCACDLVVTPEHRNHGVFKVIMDHAIEELRGLGYPYLFNLSGGSPVTHLASLGLGWKGIGALGTMRRRPGGSGTASVARDLVKRVAPLAAAYRWMRGRAHSAGHADGNPFASLDRHGAERGPVRVCRDPDAHAMVRLLGRLPLDGRIRHVRDETYFNWRFRNPLARYRFLLHGRDDIDGYLVLRADRVGAAGKAHIADLEATDPQAAGTLLDTAIRYGRFAQLSIWTATLADDTRRLLAERGFELSDEAPSLTRPQRTVLVGPVAAPSDTPWTLGGLEVLDRANWDLRMIFSDGS